MKTTTPRSSAPGHRPARPLLTLWHQVRKVLRYIRLYGVRWTWAKIRGKQHLRRTFKQLPPRRRGKSGEGHVGLLGCGSYAFSTVAHFLAREKRNVIRGVMDPNLDRAASLNQAYGALYYTDDAEEVLSDPATDLVYVVSNHSTHAEYAIRALEMGKCVHIEKPHVVDAVQLQRLCEAMAQSEGRVALGFNRPVSPMGLEIFRRYRAESGPGLINWAITGHVIPEGHWYRRPEEGGRVFGNLCHWTDFVYRMVPEGDRYPIRVRALSHPGQDDSVAATLQFGDGSLAAITFSSTHEPLDGVGERLSAQKGALTIRLDDFVRLQMEDSYRRTVKRTLRRNMGHQERIRRSLAMTRGGNDDWTDPVARVWETGELFLRVRDALVQGGEFVLDPFSGASSEGS